MGSTINVNEEVTTDISVNVNFNIYCNDCGEEMDVTGVDSTPPYYINVNRCECKDEEIEEEAHQKGYDKGYDEAKEEYDDQ